MGGDGAGHREGEDGAGGGDDGSDLHGFPPGLADLRTVLL